jgi:hypothetical protein
MGIFQNSARNGTTQAVAATAASTASAAAFATGTHQVRIVANTACHYTFAASPTAATTHPLLPALTVEYVTVTPGQKVAALRASTAGGITATDGTLWVTEISG